MIYIVYLLVRWFFKPNPQWIYI